MALYTNYIEGIRKKGLCKLTMIGLCYSNYVFICTHARTHTRTHVCVCACVCVSVRAFVRVCVCVFVCASSIKPQDNTYVPAANCIANRMRRTYKNKINMLQIINPFLLCSSAFSLPAS